MSIALYRERHGAETFFKRIKHCRRIAIRCDRLAKTLMDFVALASILLWPKLSNRRHGPAMMRSRH